MDLGSGIRKKPIPDPGSRIQGSKSTRSRIPDPDPQHWYLCCKCGETLWNQPLKITKWVQLYSSRLILWDIKTDDERVSECIGQARNPRVTAAQCAKHKKGAPRRRFATKLTLLRNMIHARISNNRNSYRIRLIKKLKTSVADTDPLPFWPLDTGSGLGK